MQLIGVVAGDCGEYEREGVPEIVKPQLADVPRRVGVFGVVPAADLTSPAADHLPFSVLFLGRKLPAPLLRRAPMLSSDSRRAASR